MTSVWSAFTTRLDDPVYKRKFIHTLTLFYSFITVGVCASQTGPALLDLQLLTDTNTEQGAVFFTGSSIGSMCGSLTMAAIFGRLNKVKIMSGTLLGAAAMVTVLPWSPYYALMVVMHGLVAFFRSGFIAAGNTDLIRTWEGERRVFLQILNFCFALGGTLAPLITQPFLAPKMNDTSLQTNTSLTANSSDTAQNNPETRVQYAYLINGVMFLIAALLFCVQHCCYRSEVEKTSTSTRRYESLDQPLPRTVFVTTAALLLSIFFFLVAIETSFAAFILTFVVTYLSWSKVDGASATSVFWACYAACRFAAIFYTEFVSPFRLLIVTSCLMMVATVGSLVASIYQSNVALWVCIALTGLSLGSQFPSTMTWAEESIMRLSPTIISLITFACTLPGVVNPLLIGYLMQGYTPLWLFYILTIECAICLTLYLSLYTWNRKVVQPMAISASVTKVKSVRSDSSDNDGSEIKDC